MWVSLGWEPARDEANAEGETTNKKIKKRHHTLCFITQTELGIAVDDNSVRNKSTQADSCLHQLQ